MHDRVTRVFVLIFAVAWFGVVVPGHQRGAITYPSSGVAGVDNLPPCHRKQTPDTPPAPRKSGKCVICMMAAMIVAPPAADEVPQHTFRGSINVTQPRVVFAPIIPLPLSERGPPVC